MSEELTTAGPRKLQDHEALPVQLLAQEREKVVNRIGGSMQNLLNIYCQERGLQPGQWQFQSMPDGLYLVEKPKEVPPENKP